MVLEYSLLTIIFVLTTIRLQCLSCNVPVGFNIVIITDIAQSVFLLFSCSFVSNSVQHHELQHARHPCPSPSPGACSNSCALSQWFHPIILSFVVPFCSCLQSSPASGSFPITWVFAPGGQAIGPSASTADRPMNIQDWFLLGWTGWIYLQSKGLSKVFSNTTVQKHQFFGTQLSSQSDSHIHTWPLEKP